ncbi:MAG: hypothetical protein R6V08_02750 [Desulfuromonadales bacterium]
MTMHAGRRSCFPAIALFAALVFPAAVPAVETGGHLKSLNLHFQEGPLGRIPDGEVSSNSLRLDFADRPGADLKWELSLENQLLYTDPPGFVPLPGRSPNRVLDMETTWNENERFANRLVVDRLNIRGRSAGINWSLGRQAVGFGRMTIFSPLDAVSPFAPDALDTDIRPGIDAVQFIRYFGLGGQLGATAVFSDDSSDHSWLGTASHNVSGIDFLGIFGTLRDREMGGAGLAGNLGGLGLKAEAAHYNGKENDFRSKYAIAAAEAWYRLDNGLVLLLEYLYNGAGSSDPADYQQVAASAAHREGLSFLVGRHYLMAAPSYEPNPLTTLSTLLIWNLEDDSFLLRPMADFSLSDSTDLEVFWTFNSGATATAGPLPEVFVPRSEFGLVGDSGGLFLKYYF